MKNGTGPAIRAENRHAWQGLFFAVLAAVCFATMPVAARLVYAGRGVDPLSLLAVRFTVGAFLLWIIRDWREPVLPSRSEWRWLVLGMGGLFATSTGYFLSLRHVPAATAALLVYTFPAFTAIFARLFFHEPLGVRRVAALVLTFAGSATLVGWSRVSVRTVPLSGLLLAILSGLTYAAFGLASQRLMRDRSASWVNRWVITGVALAFLVLRPPDTLPAGGRPLLLGGLYLALVATYVANTLYLTAVRRVGATRAGLYSTTEPLFIAALAWLVLGEAMTAGQVVGAGLVLLGVIGLEGIGSSNAAYPPATSS